MPSFHPGQLVMVDIPGTRLDEATANFLRESRIRAVCLFRRNLGTREEVVALTTALRQVMGEHALIGLDQEGGAVVRSTFLPQAPSAMALGASGDAGLALDVGAAVARGLRSLGINWNFAPVLDVNSHPGNPVIAERSFGQDPHEVTRLAGAWMRGSLAEGVACCVKHFPGHGDTHVDSHLALPTVDKSRTELDGIELLPFHALAGEAPAVMTAHIVYPQIDPDHPATLSKKVLRGILRDEWGYDGVVITDALMMKAIADRYGYGRAAVMAIDAGADMVLAQGSLNEQAQSVHALQVAFADGSLTEAQGRRAAARLDALSARYPVRHTAYGSSEQSADDSLMHRAWAKGLTSLNDATPPRLDQALRVIVQSDVPTDNVAEAGPSGTQALALFSDFQDVQALVVDDIAKLDWSKLPRDGRYNLLVSTRRDRYESSAHHWRPDLHVVLWNPFQVLDVPAPAVLTWGYAAGALAGLKQWLQGSRQAPGHAPVSLGWTGEPAP